MGDQPSDNNISACKRFKSSPNRQDNIKISFFQDLCPDIVLEIFQYLRPVDLLYSFTGLHPTLDTLIEPYTHTLDFRLMKKSYFHCLTQSIIPYSTNTLRVLRLSNAHTFGQISEIFYKLDWSRLDQLESLTFNSIKSDELSRYFLVIHPLLKNLWRLSLTFDEDDKFAEKLLLNHILTPTNQSQSLTNCFIIGITFDLSKLILLKLNETLRELTLTLSTVDDLLILFRLVSRLEILTCTILQSSCHEGIDKVQSLDSLTILTLTIKQSIIFKNLEKLLIPHIKLKRLSLKADFCDTNSSFNSNQGIGGLKLEKLFRTFSQLIELHFYLSHSQSSVQSVPDSLYLFAFKSHFWIDRSIEVFTHFIPELDQRFIYTLPFAFDTLNIVGDIPQFLSMGYPNYYANVRHLTLSGAPNLYEFTYSNFILKFFPKIRTITLYNEPSAEISAKVLNEHQWIRQISASNTSSMEAFPCVYILSNRKATHLHIRTLNVNNEDQRLFANTSKRVRQLTVYEMTKQQSINLCYFFPWIHVLTLYINTLEWFSPSNDWLSHLLTHMTLLFSLTVYYPKDMNDEKVRDSIGNTLLAVKEYFYIKCNDGILNIWF